MKDWERYALHIGIVTEYYRPWPGGISEHVHHEAKELRRRGHKVVILTGPAHGPRPDGETAIIRLGFGIKLPRNRSLCRVTMGRYMLTMRRVLRRLHLDVLHIHAPLDPVLGMVALGASETANVGTFHASFNPTFGPRLLYRALRPWPKYLYKRLHGRIAVSQEARQSIVHYFPGDYEVIPNGIDTERFHPDLPPVRDMKDGRPTILFVGRLDPRKGLPILLRAFSIVRQRVPDARLVIVGGMGRQKMDELREEISPEAVADVIFAGYVAPDVLPRYFASCDLFCSPATGQESFGIVLLEAMAAGRPPVTFDIPGYRDVVEHGKNGWLVTGVDAESLAEGLSHLLENPNLRQAMGTTARQTAQQYSWPTIVARVEERLIMAQEIALRSSNGKERTDSSF